MDNASDIRNKETKLEELIKAAGKLAVAFSGGVDSTYLLAVAHEVLKDQAVAVTVRSSVIPEREFEEACAFCRKLGVKQIVIDADVFAVEHFAENPPDRCYHCKKSLFTQIRDAAAGSGITCVCDGTNADDTDDYRPGMRALAELGILSPLKEAGITKKMIRERSKDLGLPTWDHPSMACLASRFAYGETITEEGLRAVEKAEELLRTKGFAQYRVRVHGSLARIEVMPEDKSRLLDMAEEIGAGLKTLGFSYVTMDLRGYRTGSMNEVLG